MALHPTMLWESADPAIALTKRFQFASPEAAAQWLVDTVAERYDVSVTAVDRLVISAYNLLAWLTTPTGPLLAKCCAYLPAHERLRHSAELVCWLAQQDCPVSAPLMTKQGEVQTRCAHLSLGVQRVIPGAWLEPTQPEQAQAAGLVLAQLHTALAAYPRASDFATPSPVSALAGQLQQWIEEKRRVLQEPALLAHSQRLLQMLKQNSLPALPIQLVHQDYRAANILWDRGQIVAVLDFEELRFGYRVNDFAWGAIHLGTRFHQWGPVSTAVYKNFLASYTAQQPWSTAEQAWLPLLLFWHGLGLACSAVGGPTFAACLDSLNQLSQQD